jgi:sec-independent protein translocase protein TatA
MNLGAPEVLLIMLVILIFFGPSKIPDLAKGLGQGLREFRKASRDIQEDIERELGDNSKK